MRRQTGPANTGPCADIVAGAFTIAVAVILSGSIVVAAVVKLTGI